MSASGAGAHPAAFVLLLCIVSSCAAPPPAQRPVPHVQMKKPAVRAASLEKLIHRLINEERAKEGLSALSWSDRLSPIARTHSRDMGKRGYFSHHSPEGKDFSQRYQQAGYACAIRVENVIHQGAENIALNNLYDSVVTVNGRAYYDWNSEEKIAETTVRGWMHSPGHRKNILTPHWKSEGIGIFISPEEKVYVTQNFC